MALFFDANWFDAKLQAAKLEHTHVAAALGLDAEELALVLKDQRELSARDVAVLAALLGLTPAEVAEHAGISTPVPAATADDAERMADMDARLSRIERELADIKALVMDLRSRI